MAGGSYDDATTTPGGVQSLSTLFKLANVDVERASAVPKAELWARMRDAVEDGGYRLPRVEGSWHRTPYPGVVLIHMTRIPNVDATDPEQLTRAEVEGRRQVQEYHRFLRDRVPGFERSVVVATSPAIGVRESRRVHGDQLLTRDDVLGGRRFDDEIALCGAPIEDHGAGGDTAWQYVGESGVYGIPYGCLLPLGIEGLLVAGRCFSATHDAHASARSMATCMAMGQAAGTAAAMAAASGTTPRALDAGAGARATARRRRAPRTRRDRGAGRMTAGETLRMGRVAQAIREHRLVVVLRRIEPQPALAHARRRAGRRRCARVRGHVRHPDGRGRPGRGPRSAWRPGPTARSSPAPARSSSAASSTRPGARAPTSPSRPCWTSASSRWRSTSACRSSRVRSRPPRSPPHGRRARRS